MTDLTMRRRAAGRVLLAMATAWLAGCATPTPDVGPGDVIGPDEAVLVARFHRSSKAIATITIHRGLAVDPYATLELSLPDQLHVARIKAAEGLCFSSYSESKDGRERGNAFFDSTQMTFDVRPGTITYVGDVYVTRSPRDVKLTVVDNAAETMAAVDRFHPHLADGLVFRKRLAWSPRQ